MKQCGHGHENADDQRFCGQCGEQLGDGTVLAPPTDESTGSAGQRTPVDEPADGRPKRRKAVVIGLLLVVVGAAIGGYMLFTPSAEQRYLAALEEAGVEEFSTTRAAVVNAENVCQSLDEGGEAAGSRADSIGVEHYCPDYSEDFRELRTIEVTGRFIVFDYDSFGHLSVDDECFSGDGGYGDINTSTPVVMTNTQGDVLHRTELGIGTVDAQGTCTFEFKLPVTEGEDNYVVAVGRRGEMTYTFEEIQTESPLLLTLGDITDALDSDF